MSQFDLAKVNRASVAALPWVLAKLLPGGAIFGRDYVFQDSRRADRQACSFRIKLFGVHAGTWADYATGDRGRDPVSLVAYLQRSSQADAARRLAGILGLAT